ncbi:12300_t:CDS:10, partial [Dentiscutata heterogama]
MLLIQLDAYVPTGCKSKNMFAAIAQLDAYAPSVSKSINPMSDLFLKKDEKSINKKLNNDKIEDIEADYDLTVATESPSKPFKTFIANQMSQNMDLISSAIISLIFKVGPIYGKEPKNQSQDEPYEDNNSLDIREQSSKKEKKASIKFDGFVESAKFTMLRNRNIYPLCKPFKEFSKEDAEELFDVISDNTSVEFDLPENIKDYIQHLLSGDIEDAFSKVEKSVDNVDPLFLWTREVCRHFLLYYYFGGLQIEGSEKTWTTQTVYRILDLFLIFFGKLISGIAFGEIPNEAHNDRTYNINHLQKPSQAGHTSKNDAVLYHDKDATVLYKQSYGPTEFALPHQLSDFVKLAQNGVDDLNYHFTQNNNCSITTAKKFKSIGIHGYKYLISILTTYSERWELLNIARFGVLLK